MIEQLRSDVRYALGWLLRGPAFTAVAIASLAVGIGFNTALFSIVDALLLRPLPIDRPERIVDVYTRGADGDTYSTNSYPDFLDFRAQNAVFTDMIAYSPAIAAVKIGAQSRMALGEVVTGNYFSLLGVRASIGRTLLPDDDRPGAERVIVLSHGTWTREYAGDPSVVGRTVHIRGNAYTVVGVIAPEFHGMVPMLQPEMWLPATWVEEVEPAGIQDVVPGPGETRLDRRGQRWLFVKGRLKDGETATRAEANLQVIMSQLAATHPGTNGKRPIAVASNVRIHPQADAAMRPIAAGLMVGVGLVLLVACANVANMLLARASGRQKEIGVRLAIGASRGRIVRQLLTESLVLALLGAAAGVGLAFVLLEFVQAIPLPVPVPLALALQIDARVLLFTSGAATLAGLLAGLAPALKATRPNIVAELKGDRTSLATAGGRRWTLRDGLVAAQTGVTLVLLVAAGLLTRSILEAQKTDLGFRPAGLAVLSTEVGLIGYDEARASALYDRAIERVRALPGVESVSATVRQPLAINYNRNSIFFPDRQQPGDTAIPIGATWIDDAYFTTLGVPVLQGRNFSTGDTPESPRVAIVNEALVRTYWSGQDPVGRRFRLRTADGPEFQVVGVVKDYKVDTVGERPTPYIHYALSQRRFTGEVLIARTAGDAGSILQAMRREILALEPNAVFLDNQTMEAQVDMALLPARLAAQTAALVGLVATLLAAVGLYGVIAYAVARRTREIGIRMALGAAPGGVIGLIMRQGLTVAVAGVAAGSVLAYGAARGIAGALYGVSALDPVAWGGAIATLLTASALANYVPAHRASLVDPSVALRTE